MSRIVIDSAYLLAKNAAELPFCRLSTSAIKSTRNDILDTLGTAIAGANAPGCREVARLVTENYATPQATVWGSRCKASATEAAMANGTMAHALDFDDTHDAAVLHAGVSVVPAAFAAAELVGGIDGKELLAAITIGLDLVCRMGMATSVPPVASGWMYTSLFGHFGATVTAGRLLRLDTNQMAHAMGIAYAQAAGNTQCMPDGSLTKRMQPGFAARSGLLSAMLARSGITGTTQTFDGGSGLFRVYLNKAYDRDRLLLDLGERFEGVDLSFKPYPSCRYTHAAIDAIMSLIQKSPIDPDQIKSISVGVNDQAFTNVCMPIEVKAKPRFIVDAQFSIPYCVATAIVKRQVFIDDFTVTALSNPTVLAVASKVRPFLDPDIQLSNARDISPAKVLVEMKDGTKLTAHSTSPRGGPTNPLSFAELTEKFRRCAAYGETPLSTSKTEQIIRLIENMESVVDVSVISQALA